ncbi:MAG: 30S ribosomal protein S4 [Flavobacterium sp.]|nr:MAG: 30S ribosomal protein S4 [Flavobacterium sp.]
MARYTGPKTKIARKFKEAIYGPDRSFDKKPYPPGQHGQNRKRSKQSEYSVQLAEKQKAKYTYGLLERQFENLFHKAARKKGITGENLLKFLEARLDNTVFRMGIAPSRAAARQLVTHKHITVNGSLVNIPSYTLKPGDEVGVREKSKSLEVITESTSRRGRGFAWIDFNSTSKTGKFIDFPERDQIPENIKEQLIVELYSK